MTVRELSDTLERLMTVGKLTGEEVVFDSAMFDVDTIEIYGEDLGENYIRLSNEQYDEIQGVDEEVELGV